LKIMLGVLAAGLVGVIWAGWWLTRPRVPAPVIAQIEQYMAKEGTVMFVRPVLMAFGPVAPGARQYVVDIATPFGTQGHTVEVDSAGRVKLIL
jgi:hypothetical protein